MALSGKEKAIILLSIIGADASAKILSSMPQGMASELLSQIRSAPRPSQESVSQVVSDFRRFMALPPADRASEAAQPEARPEKKRNLKPGDLLSNVPGRALIPVLLRERPQTIAFVLNELPDGRVAEVLTYLPEQRREVEYLLHSMKTNPISAVVKESVLSSIASRLS